MKVLHVLDHSLPHTDGYAMRTASILRFQAELDLGPSAMTSPFHENDWNESPETIDGIRYYRTPICRTRLPLLREAGSVRKLREALTSHVRTHRPDVLHAHSSCLWGWAACQVARRFDLPLVYEIRSFWEDGAVDQNKTSYGSFRYNVTRRLETYVARRADALVTIAGPMQQELAGRGLPPSKLFVVPNGIDADRFHELQRDQRLADELGLAGRVCLGYIGSLSAWEGVDELVRAMPILAGKLRDGGRDVTLLVIGGGEELQPLRQLVDRLNLHGLVRMLGRVPNESIERYYSILDLLVYPRRKTRLTDLVTPLKPLEAMAMGKAIVASDVGGLRELIGDGHARFYRPGDLQDLAEQCAVLITQPGRRRQMQQQAREYACTSRDWRSLVPLYRTIYDFAIHNRAPRRSTTAANAGGNGASKLRSHPTATLDAETFQET